MSLKIEIVLVAIVGAAAMATSRSPQGPALDGGEAAPLIGDALAKS